MGGVIQFESGVRLHVHNDKVARRGVEVLGTEGAFFTTLYSSFEILTHRDETKDGQLVQTWNGGPLAPGGGVTALCTVLHNCFLGGSLWKSCMGARQSDSTAGG